MRRSGAARRARARRGRLYFTFGLDADRLTALTAIAFYVSLAVLVDAIAWSLSS